MNLEEFKSSKFVKAIEENPAAFLGGLSALLYSTSKVIEAMGHSRGSRAYAKQVDYRIRNKK